MTTAGTCKSATELLGVPQPPTRGRQRLLVIALELFYRQGFNAIGIDRVIAEAGVSKTTFYKHFESKDQLMVEAVKLRDEWEREAWRRAVQELAGDDPRQQLTAMFTVLDIWFNDPDFGGCLFINVASEFPNPNDPVHQAAAAHKQATRDDICQTAQRAGATDPQGFADAYMTLFEGALVMRQVYGRNDAARVALPLIRQLIEQHMPTAPRRHAAKTARR